MTNISTKELNYVKDFLSWELYMSKLCHQYAAQVTDQSFSGMLDQAGQVHQQNFNEIYHYLEKVK
ncbi:MAG: hypothetical protein AB1767_03145 [Bacillota bacterium]